MAYIVLVYLSGLVPLVCVGVSCWVAYVYRTTLSMAMTGTLGAFLLGVAIPIVFDMWSSWAFGFMVARWLAFTGTIVATAAWCLLPFVRAKRPDVAILVIMTIGYISVWIFVFLVIHSP